MAKPKSIRSIQLRPVLGKDEIKDCLLTFLTTNLLQREAGAQFERLLQDPELRRDELLSPHPALSEPLPLVKDTAENIFLGVEGSKTGIRKKARQGLLALSSANSKASGLGAVEDDGMREALLENPLLIETMDPEHFSGAAPLWRTKAADTTSGWTLHECLVTSEGGVRRAKPLSEWVNCKPKPKKEEKKAIKAPKVKKAKKEDAGPEQESLEGKISWGEARKNSYEEWVKRRYFDPNKENWKYEQKLVAAGVIGKGKPPLLTQTDGVLGLGHPELRHGTMTFPLTDISSFRSRQADRVEENKTTAKQAETLLAKIPKRIQNLLTGLEAEIQKQIEAASGHLCKEPWVFGKDGTTKGLTLVLEAFREVESREPSELQTAWQVARDKSTKDFGLHIFFDLLAQTEYHILWDSDGEDEREKNDNAWLFKWLKYRRLVPKRDHTYTPVDPIFHPKGIEYITVKRSGKPKGSNGLYYQGFMRIGLQDPTLRIDIQVLRANEKHRMEVEWITVPLLDHGQIKVIEDAFMLRVPRFKTAHPKITDRVEYVYEPATPSGIRLQINRSILESSATPEIIAILDGISMQFPSTANPKDLWDPALVKGLEKAADLLWKEMVKADDWQERLRRLFTLTVTLETTPTRVESDLLGRRAFGIDKGLRNAGGIAVGRVERLDSSVGAIPINETLGCVFERAECLALPEDEATPLKGERNLRKLIQFTQETLATHRALVREFKGVNIKKPVALEKLSELLEPSNAQQALKAAAKLPWRGQFKKLLAEEPPKDFVSGLHYTEKLIRVLLRLLKQRRGEDRKGLGGLSNRRIKLLDELIDVHKSIAARSVLSREGTITPARKRRISSLPHIRLIHAARKKVAKERALVVTRHYDKLAVAHNCHVIVCENLLGFQRDKQANKNTNRTLNRWLHRSIADKLKFLAQASGLALVEVNPWATSKFHYRTSGPGIRMSEFHPGLLSLDWWRRKAKKDSRLRNLEVGQYYPDNGGPIFVTVDKGQLVLENADTNAAANIVLEYFRSQAEGLTEETVRYVRSYKLTGTHCVYAPAFLRNRRFDPVDGTFGPEFAEKDIPEEVDQASLEVHYRDISGEVLPNKAWMPGSEFWKAVNAAIWEKFSTAEQISAAE